MKKHLLIFLSFILNITFFTCALAGQTEITSLEAMELIQSNPNNVVVLDLRTAKEYHTSHIQGAKSIDYYAMQFQAELKMLSRDNIYIIYCRPGIRGKKTYEIMKSLGFDKVYHMSDGIQGWEKNGLPLEANAPQSAPLTSKVIH